jgi:hypothetical protein
MPTIRLFRYRVDYASHRKCICYVITMAWYA